MPNLNRVMLIGHLGADPETRTLPGGGMVANIRLATSEKWKDKGSGEEKERTEWHSITVFGRLAEICAEYLRKGAAAYFEGQLRTEKWTDKQRVERYSTKIYANSMQMLGGKREGGSSEPKLARQPSGSTPLPRQPSGEPADAGGSGSQDFDDEIPF